MELRQLMDLIAHHWGYRSLRPLQEQAMRAVLDGRDSLVVLPTGGGKSLCYQAPAVQRGGTTVVISPLIALMKDQVDTLQRVGVPAVQIDSSLTGTERFAYEMDVRQGGVRLLFVSPERLVNTDFYRLLQDAKVHTFAIDEAHCISHWGHDFRPEYRQLARLREHFPGATVHGYTATATEQVRRDIIAQLGLREPVVLVGNFDRPNLTYRVLPRLDVLKQVQEVLDRYPGEAGIIYCLRKRDVDDLAASLKERGHKVAAYHAGLSSEDRRVAQDAFAAEQVDVVVATVAFGMGIDRSNVRFILHTALPKTLEHYQQETGRAGRDGLEAECVLLYSGADVLTLKWMLEKSAAEAESGIDPAFLPGALKHLEDMARYCRGAVCRHKALVNYFGQPYEAPTCNACDICLGDTQDVPDAPVVAQKILSCVARVKEGFGIGQVVGILRGENTENIRKRGHDKLSTFGLLQEHSKVDVRDWVYQLIGQGVLYQLGDEYPVLKLNDASWEVMRGKRGVRLIQLVRRKKGERPEKSKAAEVSWEGVDEELYEAMRDLRRALAGQESIPPLRVFSDDVLRDMARIRPSTMERFHMLSGVGDNKLNRYGAAFLKVILDHCAARGLATDVNAAPRPVQSPAAPPKVTPRMETAFALFRAGTVIEDVMHQMGLARSTISDYLAAYIRVEKPALIRSWVDDDLYQRIAAAARQVGTEKLKPIFLVLGEKVSYDDIRLVVAHLLATAAT
jgi:ATP-dependent DNA helicase RecQ